MLEELLFAHVISMSAVWTSHKHSMAPSRIPLSRVQQNTFLAKRNQRWKEELMMQWSLVSTEVGRRRERTLRPKIQARHVTSLAGSSGP